MRLGPQPGERIDRARPSAFTFDGERFAGFAGDTIGSALFATGRRVFSRSFKYHRPRGLLCCSGHCANCLMTVDGVPNVRVCVEPVREGADVRGQNVLGSLDRDLLAVVDRAGGPFTPVGFYYRTMIRPRRLWPLYEAFLRTSRARARRRHDAGRGRDDTEHRRVDVLVVGGGRSGREAAAAAAAAGGDACCSSTSAASCEPESGRTSVLAPGERDRRSTRAGSSRSTPATSSTGSAPGRIVVATGAIEQPLVFPGNDLVGVMLPDGRPAARRRVVDQPGTTGGRDRRRRASAPASPDQLERAGVEVAARRRPPRPRAARIAAAGAAAGSRSVAIDGRRDRLRPARRLGRPPAGLLAARPGRRPGRIRRRGGASSSRPSSRRASRRSALRPVIGRPGRSPAAAAYRLDAGRELDRDEDAPPGVVLDPGAGLREQGVRGLAARPRRGRGRTSIARPSIVDRPDLAAAPARRDPRRRAVAQVDDARQLHAGALEPAGDARERSLVGADHDRPPARADRPFVDEPLDGRGEHHADEVVAGEHERLLDRPPSPDHDPARADPMEDGAGVDRDEPALADAECMCGCEHVVRPLSGLQLAVVRRAARVRRPRPPPRPPRVRNAHRRRRERPRGDARRRGARGPRRARRRGRGPRAVAARARRRAKAPRPDHRAVVEAHRRKGAAGAIDDGEQVAVEGPSTFCARTSAPVRSGSTQTRTFGTPSTVIRQFAQLPVQHWSPRGRWYLKLREKTRRPVAKRAEAIESPAKPANRSPANVNCRAGPGRSARRAGDRAASGRRRPVGRPGNRA